jgi:hypothetical protein
MQMNASRMIVTRGDIVDKNAQIIVRLGTATLRDGSRNDRPLLERKDGVTAVERPDRRHWRIVFADGSDWLVERDPDCGCGGAKRRS